MRKGNYMLHYIHRKAIDLMAPRGICIVDKDRILNYRLLFIQYLLSIPLSEFEGFE